MILSDLILSCSAWCICVKCFSVSNNTLSRPFCSVSSTENSFDNSSVFLRTSSSKALIFRSLASSALNLSLWKFSSKRFCDFWSSSRSTFILVSSSNCVLFVRCASSKSDLKVATSFVFFLSSCFCAFWDSLILSCSEVRLASCAICRCWKSSSSCFSSWISSCWVLLSSFAASRSASSTATSFACPSVTVRCSAVLLASCANRCCSNSFISCLSLVISSCCFWCSLWAASKSALRVSTALVCSSLVMTCSAVMLASCAICCRRNSWSSWLSFVISASCAKLVWRALSNWVFKSVMLSACSLLAWSAVSRSASRVLIVFVNCSFTASTLEETTSSLLSAFIANWSFKFLRSSSCLSCILRMRSWAFLTKSLSCSRFWRKVSISILMDSILLVFEADLLRSSSSSVSSFSIFSS